MSSTCISIHCSPGVEMRVKEVAETMMVHEWTVFYIRYENVPFHSHLKWNKYSIYPAQVYGVLRHVVNAVLPYLEQEGLLRMKERFISCSREKQ